jgi:hypothetical protein
MTYNKMCDDEDGDKHVHQFCLVFVMQAKTGQSQLQIYLACLPIDDYPNNHLKKTPKNGLLPRHDYLPNKIRKSQ